MSSDTSPRLGVALRSRPAWATPVAWWGSLGAISSVFVVVVLAQWVAGGISAVHPGGADPLSTGKLILLRVVVEGGQFAVMLVLVARHVVAPLRARRRLGFDGLFLLAAFSLNFWDPMDNYNGFNFQYNAHLVNVASWGDRIPGFAHGGDTWAVPVFFVFGAYVWAFYVASWLGCAIVQRLGRARPSWGVAQRFAVAFLALAVLEAIAENVYLLTDAIANVRTAHGLTVLSHTYQGWPVYNPFLFALTWTVLAWLRWTRDERDLTAVERGVERVPIRARAAVRFLAIFAFLQVTYLTLYFLPWNLLAAGAHRAALPSYFPVPT